VRLCRGILLFPGVADSRDADCHSDEIAMFQDAEVESPDKADGVLRRPKPSVPPPVWFPTVAAAFEADVRVPRPDTARGTSSLCARIERMLIQCRRRRGPMSLLCVEVERIDVPDGQEPEGLERQVDEDVAMRIRSRVRGSDRIVRESEREAVVLLDAAGEDVARLVSRRFAGALGDSYRVDKCIVKVTVRIGWATFPADGNSGADLLRCARRRMSPH
jgi:GGDEF domain-containing protein